MVPCATPELDALEAPVAPLPINSVPSEFKLKPSELVPLLRQQIDELIIRAIKSNNLEDFRKIRERDIGEYNAFVIAISRFVTANLDASAEKKLILGTLTSHEQWFRQNGPDVLGVDAVNQALFHLITYRKAYQFISELKIAAKLTEPLEIAEDCSLAKRCYMAASWVWYHYELLLVAPNKKLPPSNDVLKEILNSLKFVDIMYSCAKRAYLLRYPEKSPHRFFSEEHPCDNVSQGSVEAIASDALNEFNSWADSRERANKTSIPQ